MTTILLISWLILIVLSLKGAEALLAKAGKL